MAKSQVLSVFSILASCVSSLLAADNIILFIGDGMGFEHVQAGRLYRNGSDGIPLSFETSRLFRGQAVTKLPSGAVTDSATAGTALATGYQHPVNGVISMGANNSIKTTILELAKAKGVRTGIITTDSIGGATPGAFGAHEPDRTYEADIRYDYLMDDTTYLHPASRPNLLFGGGFDDPYLIPGPNQTYVTIAQSLGYSVVKTASALELLEPTSYALGLFGSSWAPMDSFMANNSAQPRLPQMVKKALSLLQNDAGFFLMVEGALIDKLSHSNDRNFVPEVAELDLAVQEAFQWMEQSGQGLLVIVTADHETGGLSVPDGQVITPGTIPALTFSTTGHTGAHVPIYATWPAGLQDQTIDNTETFFMMEDWLSGASGQPPVVEGLAVVDIKQSSASVTWTTLEPCTGLIQCYANAILVASGSHLTRSTVHRFSLTDLLPDTDYQVEVISTDLAGFSGAGAIGFRTASADVDAYVQAEPQLTLGSRAGSYTALAAPGEGQVQTLTESASGVGAGLDAIYTLHTTAPVKNLSQLTLNASFTWTARDRGSDHVQLSVYNVVNQGWEWLAQNTGGNFVLTPPQAYVNSSGDLRVRFANTELITREKKDVLTIDWLQADVVAGPPDTVAPQPPIGFTVMKSTEELTAILAWSANTEIDLAGYWVRRTDWTEPVFTTALSYTDRVMTGGGYSYNVAAVDFSGNASETTATITILLENQKAPSAPLNLLAQAGDGEVLLTWDKNPEWDVIGYNIYLVQGDSRILLDEMVVANSYRHSGLVNGQTYVYQVAAVDSSLESLPSVATQASPSATPTVWVDSIVVSLQSAGKNWKATAALQVLADRQPAAGATVTGDWLLDGQLLVSGVSGVSGATGEVSLNSPLVKASTGTIMFRVTNVVLPGHAYNPAGHVTEGSVIIGF